MKEKVKWRLWYWIKFFISRIWKWSWQSYIDRCYRLHG